uniref:Activating signal cointegrator 1 n=1 Tax=Hydra vulgaris TaxID=6087 RepID=T2MCF0_HYDVU
MNIDENFKTWFRENLSNLLGFPAGDDLINYILLFESERDIQEYFRSLLDFNQPKSKQFFEEFLKRWKPLDKYKINSVGGDSTSDKKRHDDFSQKRNKTAKKDLEKSSQKSSVGQKDFKNVNEFPSNGRKDIKEKYLETTSTPLKTTNGNIDKDFISSENNQVKGLSPFKRKNLKYVPLYSADGKLKTETILLPGRHACQCLAQKHKLINNCFQCGRIVCEQEGSGPCIFCENLVCSIEEQEILCRESKKSKKLKEQLMNQKAEVFEEENKKISDSDLQNALAQKDKLLEFDKNSTKRTKVIDDEADYFSTDSRWLSKKEKESLAKKEKEIRDQRFKSKLDKRICLDFLGREVHESTQEFFYNGQDDEVKKTVSDTKFNGVTVQKNNSLLVDPRIFIESPKFQANCFKVDANLTSKNQKQFNSQHKMSHQMNRLQDKELQEVVDRGMCLSMHQPWASLLVHGIKKIEGRSWYSTHRGRLWIAATAKEPEKELIQQIENQYRLLNADKVVDFPKEYPIGCLLGCVNVVDCMSNKDYFNSHPACEEDSSSEYLFVCENPQPLKVMFSMKGQHKIYKLDAQVHASARKNLLFS